MGSGASRKAEEERLENIEDLVISGAGVSAVVVAGAGVDKCNGVYARDGVRDGAPVFRSVARDGDLLLFRQRSTTGDCWFVADRDKVERVLDDDTDYYHFYSEDGGRNHLPPLDGWDAGTGDYGAEPAPTLQLVVEGPASFVARGAGAADANGAYARDGMYEGAPLYKNGDWWLYRGRANDYRWMIGHREKIDVSEGDLYQAQLAVEFPPHTGWELAADGDGVLPAPTLTALDATGAPLSQMWIPTAAIPPVQATATVVSATPVAVTATLAPVVVKGVVVPK